VKLLPTLLVTTLLGIPSGAYSQIAAAPQAPPQAQPPATFGAPYPIAPPPARTGWDYLVTARLDSTYTDNVYLTDRNRTSSFVFSPGVSLSAHQDSLRTTFNANVDVAYDAYTNATDLDGPRVTALIDGTARTTDERLSIRGRVATDLQSSNQLGIMAATSRSIGGNQVQVVNYAAGPALRMPMSDTIVAQASYEASGVSFLEAPVGNANVPATDALMHNARASLSNETATTPLRWTFSGMYQKRDMTGPTPASERESGEANVRYILSPNFALIGTGGYEHVREPTLNDRLSGAYGSVGFRAQPSERSSLMLLAGYRYQRPNYSAQATYNFSERLDLVAGYDQGVDSAQGLLNGDYAGLVQNAAGVLIDPATGLPPILGNAAFDYNNQAFRFSRYRFGVHGVLGRTFYRATGTYERRKANSVHGESWQAGAALGRYLSPNMTVVLEATYVKTTSPALTPVLGLAAETLKGSASIDYRMTQTLTASLAYTHLKRSTSLIDYRENAVVLSLRKTF
jgi:uncharacterized protein (PEP-CTERM system associated)